ncbi:phosphotransferase [Desulfuromonas versatilis]|uniref:Phosphotransferase n=1 Tax=Desulfuromonas versatilis TaxID=2802975 RepID=A0ABM8HUF0_9BACT|nr:phosphotransferase [Desulfuromonas versatilis]BCR04115.1 phosphotransferase [Desulfuromonas versatilis]
MLIEMHCHTREHSACSHIGALELIERVFAKGLQGVVFTDHHFLWDPLELARLRRQAGVPDHFLILSGQETCSAELGDVLIYGARETFARGTPLARIRQSAPDAALVWAHPYRKQRLPTAAKLNHPLLDAIEIFNSNHTVRENSRGLCDWHRHRFTAIAGTDTHGADYAGLYPTIFDHPVKTIDELALEIRRGRCRPFFKEIPRAGSKSQVTEVTFGAKGQDEVRERIIIQTLDSSYKWRSAERAHKIMAAIAAQGFSEGRFRVPRAIDEDPATRTLIQQGLRGKSLFDKLLKAPVEDGQHFVRLAACWLARLHNGRLQLTPAGEFAEREQKRLENYVKRFREIDHPHTRRAEEIMERIAAEEQRLGVEQPELLIQGHGDYHPKNIFIGQDNLDNPNTLFVAAIDFESSFRLPPAFDVGCFLAQFRNQFFRHPQVLENCPEAVFLDAYLEHRETPAADFLRQVELYRARTNLGIAAFLIKVGLGDSADLWRVLVEAEQALTMVDGASSGQLPEAGAG